MTFALPVLAVAAALGGALNAVAGGGSFVTFPALVFFGMSPIAANATSTVALWSSSIASAAAYRRDLENLRKNLPMLGAASLVGGGIGAWLLLQTHDVTFARIVPWLLLVATALFAISGPLVPRLRALGVGRGGSGRMAVALGLGQLIISIYGGYFGGGMGILMLAAFALCGQTDIHAMNGLKSILGALINGVAIVAFVIAGIVHWPEALTMAAGSAVGAYGGAALAHRLPTAVVRSLVIAIGTAMAVWFFLR